MSGMVRMLLHLRYLRAWLAFLHCLRLGAECALVALWLWHMAWCMGRPVSMLVEIEIVVLVSAPNRFKKTTYIWRLFPGTLARLLIVKSLTLLYRLQSLCHCAFYFAAPFEIQKIYVFFPAWWFSLLVPSGLSALPGFFRPSVCLV